MLQRTLTVQGRITVQLVSSLTRLDVMNEEIMLLLNVCSEAAKSKLVKLKTSCTVIYSYTISVLWMLLKADL